MEDWVGVYSTDRIYMAEIAKQVLFDNGINAVIINKKDSSYHFGLIEVHVKKDLSLKARHHLKDLSDASNAEPENE